jgi:peroxiredoxin
MLRRIFVRLSLLLFCGSVWAAPLQFHLRDAQGGVHTPAEWIGQRAIVLFFVTTDCPVGNSYVPEMNRIHDAYAARGISVYAVQADPAIAEAEVVKYAREFHYGFPLLLDPDQVLVRHTNATVTPQAAVLLPDGKLVYLGRIDNRVVDFGKSRPQATQLDVRLALDALVAGKSVTFSTNKSIGCAIPRGKR